MVPIPDRVVGVEVYVNVHVVEAPFYNHFLQFPSHGCVERASVGEYVVHEAPYHHVVVKSGISIFTFKLLIMLTILIYLKKI